MGISLQQLENTVEKVKRYVDNKSPDIATALKAGVVQPDGDTIKIDKTGKISTTPAKTATSNTAGVVLPDGKTIKLKDGTISVPVGSKTALGVFKIDENTIVKDTNNVLSVDFSTVSHNDLKNIGVYTHEDIDAHIKNDSIHSIQSMGKLELLGSAFNDFLLDNISINKTGGLQLTYNTTDKEYIASGSFTTPIYDTNIEHCQMRYVFYYGIYDLNIEVIKFYTRTGSTPAYNAGTWTNWIAVENDNKIKSMDNRYFQVKAELSTANQEMTPVINSIICYYGADVNTVLAEGLGDYPSLDARFKAVEKDVILDTNENNQLTRTKDGLYINIKDEVYIGTEETINDRYKLFIDVEDSSGGTTYTQVNWEEVDVNSPNYILNKPDIPSIDGLATEKYVDELVNTNKMYVSNMPGNQIIKQYDGIYVSKPTLNLEVSKAPGNVLENLEDGLYVANTTKYLKISQDNGNIAEYRVDGFYVPNAKVKISTEKGNDIIEKPDGLYVTTQEEIDTATFNKMVTNAINELNE